jgi:hypothetical protein
MKLRRRYKVRLDDLEMFFLNEILRLRWTGKQDKPEKLCTIESYIGIDNIKINENNSFTPDITNEIQDINFIDNLKKNICKLSFLNEQVYKNHNITKIITNCPEKKCNVNVSIQNIKHNFNNIGCLNINISNCTIINHNLQTSVKRNFYSIDDALEKAENEFKNTIEYNNNIYVSIDEYEKNLAGLKYIEGYKREYPTIVYDCLDILDKLVKFHKHNGEINNPNYLSENFLCRSIGENEICNRCRGYLRLCGFDCSTEDEIRMFDGKPYKIHLKPYRKMDGTKNSEKSLRIYFRWDTDKIEVGYIGKHL